MKKVLPLLLALFVFFVPFVSQTYAYSSFGDSGTHGKTWTLKKANGVKSTTSVVTDGDASTSVTLSNGDSLVYYLNEVKDITKIYWYVVEPSSYLQFRLHHADGTETRLQPTNMAPLDVSSASGSDVVSVEVINFATGTNLNKVIKEVDFFATTPVIEITHNEISNVLSTVTDKSFSVTWNPPKDNPNFVQTNIYKNGIKIANVAKEIDVWKDDDVLPNTSYTYKLSAVYDDGFETNGVSVTDITGAEPPDPSKIPPSNVTDLAVSNITDTSLELGWLNPDDDDLDKINIYKNGTLLESISVNSTYKVIGLSPNTSYTFSVSAVDTDGNEGTKQSTTATTLDGKDNVAPDAPKGLTVEAGNKVLYLKWNKNLEDDLLGYNVFVNGVKQNTIPIKNTFFTIADLSNGTDYNVSISAVDTSSNESPRTTEKQGIPNEDGMPLLSTDYDLIDVAKGVENWFSSFWLIIAFAIAIPLSFYIASRIKLMFLE